MVLIPSLQPTHQLLRRALNNEAVFVTGPRSSGKTYLVKKVFYEDFKSIYVPAWVDCFTVGTATKLYQKVCQHITAVLNIDRAKRAKKRLPDPGEPISLSDVPRIMNTYQKIAERKGFEKIFVIFDHAEALKHFDLLDPFVALCRCVSQDLTPLAVVVISYESPTDIIQLMTQKSIPIAQSFQDRIQVVSVNVWAKEDVVQWILKEPPNDTKHRELYSKFVKNVVTLIYVGDGREPRKVLRYCQHNFRAYLDYHRNRIKDNIRRQYKMDPFAPIDDKECEGYSLGSYLESAAIQSFLTHYLPLQQRKKRRIVYTSKCSAVRLNLNLAIMVVAAYVAGYSKSCYDKANFANLQNKKLQPSSIDQPLVNRPFTLERLMQIYIKLQQRSVGARKLAKIFNCDASLGDIERLENVNILQHLSGWDLSSDARYKITPCVKRNLVDRLAEHAELDLRWFKGL